MDSLSDLKLYERAFKMRWEIPDEYKQALIRRMMTIVANPDSSDRAATAASRVLLAAESQNQNDQVEHDKLESIDESRNRFLAVAQRLGIGQTIDASIVGRQDDSDQRDSADESAADADGRKSVTSGEDGEEKSSSP